MVDHGSLGIGDGGPVLLRRGVVWRGGGILWLGGRVVRGWCSHLRSDQRRVPLESKRDLDEPMLALLAHDWDLDRFSPCNPRPRERSLPASNHVIVDHVLLERRREGGNQIQSYQYGSRMYDYSAENSMYEHVF